MVYRSDYNMSFLSRILGRKEPPPDNSNDPLVPVPVPSLTELLLHLEKEKGEPLTMEEVLHHRDKCVRDVAAFRKKVTRGEARVPRH